MRGLTRIAAAAACATAIMASPAGAAVLQFSYDPDLVSSIQGFDPTLGTLNSVAVVIGTTVNTLFSIDANGPGDVFDVTIDRLFSSDYTIGGLTDQADDTISFTLNDIAYPGVGLLTGCNCGASNVYSDAPTLALFSTSGLIDADFVTDFHYAFHFNPAVGSATVSTNTQFNTLRIVYTYGPARGFVPEPQTWALMLLGFGLAGAMIRRQAAVFHVPSGLKQP